MPSVLDTPDTRKKAAALARIAARLDHVEHIPLLDSGLTLAEAQAMDSEGLLELVVGGSKQEPVYEIWDLTVDGRVLAQLWATRKRSIFVRIGRWSVSRLPTLVYDIVKIAVGVIVGWFLKKYIG